MLGKVARRRYTRDFVENFQLIQARFPVLRRRVYYPFQILLYHRVLPTADPFAIDAVTTREFDRHLDVLTSFFRVISLEQLVGELDDGISRPGTICITFDDGYKDNFQYALPILRKYGVPATVFLATDVIGSDGMLWPDRVLFVIRQCKINQLRYDEAGIFDVNMQNEHLRRRTGFQFLEWLKKFSPAERDERINRLMQVCELSEPPAQRLMLNWHEVRQMHKDGIRFGAHTKSHPILSFLSDDELKREIFGSKSAVENALGVSICSFAYPNGRRGDFDERSKEVIKAAGFRCAVTTCGGANDRASDNFELNRTMPWDRHPDRFYARLLSERFSGGSN